MQKIQAAITAVGGYVPEYILTNDEISRMVDTSDEWIMTRIGIKTRHILKDPRKATSDLAVEAIKDLLRKRGIGPDEIDLVVWCGATPDMQFPSTANIISDKVGITKAFGFDLMAGCSGFIFALTTASKYVETGVCKKVIVVGADKMSTVVDYSDRTTCPIFGDGAGAVLLEPDTEGYGVIDADLHSDGSGRKYLFQAAGGSLLPTSFRTIVSRQHYIYQEGQPVFKAAVSNMADTAKAMMDKHHLTPETLAWLVPHQANMRIIEATAHRMELAKEKVMINITRYGNTTAGTLPLCLWDYEKCLKKGDNIILAAFGAGFTWGAVYLKWAYDGSKIGKELPKE